MNWLERARREIGGAPTRPTANSADGNPMAAMAVLSPLPSEKAGISIGGNGSPLPERMHDAEALREAFEERAAIIEYDGGLSRSEAERAAWVLVMTRRRLH